MLQIKDKISKAALLNWLSSCPEEISIVELKEWINARTNEK